MWALPLEEARVDAGGLVLGLDLETSVEGFTEAPTDILNACVPRGVLVLRDADTESAVVLRHFTYDLVVAVLVHDDLGEHELVLFGEVEDEEVAVLLGVEDNRVLLRVLAPSIVEEDHHLGDLVRDVDDEVSNPGVELGLLRGVAVTGVAHAVTVGVELVGVRGVRAVVFMGHHAILVKIGIGSPVLDRVPVDGTGSGGARGDATGEGEDERYQQRNQGRFHGRDLLCHLPIYMVWLKWCSRRTLVSCFWVSERV